MKKKRKLDHTSHFPLMVGERMAILEYYVWHHTHPELGEGA